MFDANAFTQSTTTSSLSTTRIPVPIGEYPGVIKEVSFRQAEGKKTPGQFYTFAESVSVVRP